jgi:hypothetical protein
MRGFAVCRLPIAFAIASAVVVTYLIGSQQLTFGSFEGNWVHAYYRAFSAWALLPFLVAGPCVLLLAAWSNRSGSRHPGLVILVWFALAFFLQLAFRSQFPGTLASNVVSSTVNSFYSPILEHSAYDLMRDFESLQPTLPLHASYNMPGKVMLFYLLGAVTDSPQAMAYLLIALSNFGGVLLYFVVLDLFKDRRTALFSCVLYFFLPCRLYLLPRLNVVSPVLILLCLLLLVRFLRSPRPTWAILLGGSLYTITFFDPLILTMGLLFAAILTSATHSRRVSIASVAQLVVWASASFLVVHAAMLVIFDYDLFRNFIYLINLATTFNTHTSRPYAVWIVQNPIDFLINAGVASSVLFFAYLATLARDRRTSTWGSAPALFALSSLAVLVCLDAAGVNRGEVIRLWIFLASFWVVVPAHYCARESGDLPFYAVLLATLLQASITINMVKFGIVF